MILSMVYQMFSYQRNRTDQVPEMLTPEEMQEEVQLKDLHANFYLVVTGSSDSFVPKRIQDYKRFVTFKSG